MKRLVIILAIILISTNCSVFASTESSIDIPVHRMTPYVSSDNYGASSWESVYSIVNGYDDYTQGYWTTASEEKPYVMINLGGTYYLDVFTLIYTIPDTFDVYDIYTSEDGYNWTLRVTDFTASAGVQNNDVVLDGVKAAWVKCVRKSGKYAYSPQLCEVGAKGFPVAEASNNLCSPSVIKAEVSTRVNEEFDVIGKKYTGGGDLTLDGDLYSSYWTSDGTDAAWISYDLGEIKKLSNAVIYSSGDSGYSVDIYTKTSGEEDWKLYKENIVVDGVVESAFATTPLYKYNFDLSEAPDSRYVKFMRCDEGVWTVSEMCINAVGENNLLCEIDRTNWQASAYSTSAAYPDALPALAINDNLNPGNWWESGDTQSMGDWFMLDLGEETVVEEIAVLGANQTVSVGQIINIEASVDGARFEKIAQCEVSKSGQALLSAKLNGISAKFIKLVLTKDNDKFWDINDIKIYNNKDYISDISFTQVNGVKEVNINNLRAGKIRSNLVISSAADTGKNGLIITGLYDISGTEEMVEAAITPFSFGGGLQRVYTELYVDPQKYGFSETGDYYNLALGKNAVYTYNRVESGFNGLWDYPASNVTDGNDSSFAVSIGAWNYGVKIDLGEIEEVGYVELGFVEQDAAHPDIYPGGWYATDFEIITSVDGVNWTVVAEEHNNSACGDFKYSFNPVKARFVQINDLAPQENIRQMGINYFNIFSANPENNMNYAATGKVTFKTIDGVTVLPSSAAKHPCYANDDDTETYARAANNWNWMLELDMGEIKEAGFISFEFAENQYPVNFDVFVTDEYTEAFDVNEWTCVYSNAGNKRAGKFNINFDPQNIRYVRIRDNVAQTDVRQMAVSDITVSKKPSTYELRTYIWDSLNGMEVIKDYGVLK